MVYLAGMGLQLGASTQVVGVYVRQFKNLYDLWLPWASRMVLVGANGVGKSNPWIAAPC